jgi:hypothetical protein
MLYFSAEHVLAQETDWQFKLTYQFMAGVELENKRQYQCKAGLSLSVLGL